MKFTLDELRRAVESLATIERDGDPDEWSLILRQAQDSAPAAAPWGNDPIGASINAGILARRLCKLLCVDQDECDLAAEVAFSQSRQRAVYNALIMYSDELTGRTATPAPAQSAPATPQTSVRIVAGKEGVA
jgi:hypothetical protein